MLTSFQHRFIFLKTKKTASTSLEMALSTLCGPNDIVSPVGGRWDVVREENFGVLPRNFSRLPDVELRYREALKDGNRKAIRDAAHENRFSGGCTAHMRAREVRAWVGEEFWDQAVKITSERHPYEKALSLARFRFRGDPETDREAWNEHVDQVVMSSELLGYRIYSIDGVPAVKRENVILYDTLVSDAQRIMSTLGLTIPVDMPQTRTTQSDGTLRAAEILTSAQKRRLRRRCAPEFEFLGWKE